MNTLRRYWNVILVVAAVLPGCESKKDCISSDECRTRGRCTLVQGQCVVASRADCEHAEICANEGLCNFDSDTGTCVATRESCKQAKRCKEQGYCTVGYPHEENKTCMRCEDSSLCAQQGACEATSEGYCAPRNDEDCRRSKNCGVNGECRRVGDRCEK